MINAIIFEKLERPFYFHFYNKKKYQNNNISDIRKTILFLVS